jgi:uncharacterized protein (AIM24 family)
MRVEVIFRPSNSLARVVLSPHEIIQLEQRALVAATNGLELENKTRMENPPLPLPAGESGFPHAHTAGAYGEQLFLAPQLPGDVSTVEMKCEILLVRSK